MTPARSGTVLHQVVPAHLACRIGARAQAGEHNAWPAVVAIALGSFALVFSEVIPVGLARERGREVPAPRPGTTDRAGKNAQRTR